jgi:hypothetical protein
VVSRKSFALLLFFGIAVSVLLIFGLRFNECEARENTIPQIPSYTGATLTEETTPFDSPGGKIINLQYKVNVSPQNVLDFYEDLALCGENKVDNRVRCDGKAEPFGTYTIWVDFSQPDTTSYVTEVRWDRCGRREGVSFDNP